MGINARLPATAATAAIAVALPGILGVELRYPVSVTQQISNNSDVAPGMLRA
jgi:hypothetical protein